MLCIQTMNNNTYIDYKRLLQCRNLHGSDTIIASVSTVFSLASARDVHAQRVHGAQVTQHERMYRVHGLECRFMAIVCRK
jgi:hypothetical protein